MKIPGDMEEDLYIEAVEPPPPPTLPTGFNTLQTVSLLVIATILTAVALSYTQAMMVPFMFALFLSYFVAPAIGTLKKKYNFPHWLAVLATLLGLLLLCAIFVLVLRGSILRMIESFYQYEARLSEATQVVANFLARFDIKFDHDSLMARIHDLPIFSFVQSAAGITLTILADFLLVIVFLGFLVSGKNTGEPSTGLSGDINIKVRSYLITKTVMNFIVAVLTWIVYAAFGLDMSLMFAMLAFVAGYIPSVGGLVALVLPLPIAYLQFGNSWPFWGILIGPAVAQAVIGNTVEPKFMGRGLDLHPVTVMLSLMFWGIIWGIAGTFLAVPITAVLKTVLERHPLTKNFSEILAGRSPL